LSVVVRLVCIQMPDILDTRVDRYRAGQWTAVVHGLVSLNEHLPLAISLQTTKF